jgi:hypothetical protein
MGGLSLVVDPRGVVNVGQMEGLTGLALAVSMAALAVSVAALTRGAPARLRDEADSASRMARNAMERADGLSTTWESAKATYGEILEAINAERETIQRHRARLSAQQSRENAGAAAAVPQSREDMLADLRVSSGLVNSTTGS